MPGCRPWPPRRRGRHTVAAVAADTAAPGPARAGAADAHRSDPGARGAATAPPAPGAGSRDARANAHSPTPTLPSPSLPAPLPSIKLPANPVPAAPSLPSPTVAAPTRPAPTDAGGSGGRAAATGAVTAARSGGVEGSGGPARSLGRTAAAPVVTVVARVAAACTELGRLLSDRVADATAAAADGGRPGGGGSAAGAAGIALAAEQQGLARATQAAVQDGEDGARGGSGVVAALGGLAPTDGPALAALAIGMVLLAVTAVAAYALVAGHAGSQRRRLLARGARGPRHDAARHPDAVALVVLMVVSLAFWSAIACWLLTRGG